MVREDVLSRLSKICFLHAPATSHTGRRTSSAGTRRRGGKDSGGMQPHDITFPLELSSALHKNPSRAVLEYDCQLSALKTFRTLS